MAMEYRQQFNSDVFIDLLGYRKYGHNEGDEPRFTQPLLYKAISSHKNAREIYAEKLLTAGSVEADLAKQMEKEFRGLLQEKLEMAKKAEPSGVAKPHTTDTWQGFRTPGDKDFAASPDTSVTQEKFHSLAQKITSYPEDFKAFSKISKLFAERKKMITDGVFDWAMGELMAYATLLDEGFPVRMSGQDCERGTFSHRHAIIKQEDSEREYCPLQHVTSEDKTTFEIYNSLLSEYAVLGFEFGYSWATPNALTLWEAQFGDFMNGAQIIIDQYISSAEAKWKKHSGLVMLLPHGYEGQGPEHSSARIERFLQMSANWNWQVVNCTTPANMFHALRRQMHRDFRVPLVAMTPKSLLRHPDCVSPVDDFIKGGFREVIDDDTVKVKDVKRVLLCSGKIYYELRNRQQETGRKDIAIVRLEQLYPCPDQHLSRIYEKYSGAEFAWVQEEPKNMGAWTFLLRWESNHRLRLISRRSSSSPATGFAKVHVKEQEAIISEAFR
jgi:2-oxoglutarate dehydrogenase E1 component